AEKTDDEFLAREPRLDQHRFANAKAQVDVVPGDGRIAPERRRRSGHPARVRVAFDDRTIAGKRRLIKRVRKLAQAAARRRNKAALLQHASGHEAAATVGTTDLPPEAEGFACRHNDAVERAQRAAQVVHLSELKAAFG